MKVRVKFRKYGPVRFIGHLDVMRFFQKAIRRAELDIAYSAGYSPHQIMSFAAPLGVGLYSNGEYLDIELEKDMSTKEMKERLNATMADGVDILSVKLLPEDAGNAMASVAAAGYTVRIRPGHEPAFTFGKDFDAFMAQDEITFEKETKKSTKVLNLKESIFDYRIEDNGIYLLVDASSSGNIKPTMVMEAYYAYMGEKTGEFDFIVTREETYMRNQENTFIPLEAIGKDT